MAETTAAGGIAAAEHPRRKSDVAWSVGTTDHTDTGRPRASPRRLTRYLPQRFAAERFMARETRDHRRGQGHLSQTRQLANRLNAFALDEENSVGCPQIRSVPQAARYAAQPGGMLRMKPGTGCCQTLPRSSRFDAHTPANRQLPQLGPPAEGVQAFAGRGE